MNRKFTAVLILALACGTLAFRWRMREAEVVVRPFSAPDRAKRLRRLDPLRLTGMPRHKTSSVTGQTLSIQGFIEGELPRLAIASLEIRSDVSVATGDHNPAATDERSITIPVQKNGHFAAELTAGRWRPGELYPFLLRDAQQDVILDGTLQVSSTIVLRSPPLVRADLRIVGRPDINMDTRCKVTDLDSGRYSYIDFEGRRLGGFVPVSEASEAIGLEVVIDGRPVPIVIPRGPKGARLEGVINLDRELSEIDVRAISPAGSPIGGSLTAQAHLPSGPGKPYFCEPTSPGVYRLLASRTDVTLVATRPGFRAASFHLTSKQIAAGRASVDLTLSPLGANGTEEIRGQVVHKDGRPLGGLAFSAFPWAGSHSNRSPLPVVVKTDRGGVFRFTNLSKGGTHIVLSHPDYPGATRWVLMKPGYWVRLSIDALAKVTIRANAAPAQVTIACNNLHFILEHTTKKITFTGRFGRSWVIRYVPPGEYNLRVFSADGRVFGQQALSASANRLTPVRVALAETVLVRGRLVNSRGQPIVEARVRAHSVTAMGRGDAAFLEGKTDSDGSFNVVSPSHTTESVDACLGGVWVACAKRKDGYYTTGQH